LQKKSSFFLKIANKKAKSKYNLTSLKKLRQKKNNLMSFSLKIKKSCIKRILIISKKYLNKVFSLQ